MSASPVSPGKPRSLYHNEFEKLPSVNLWNGAGTNHARITDWAPVWICSRPHLVRASVSPTRSRSGACQICVKSHSKINRGRRPVPIRAAGLTPPPDNLKASETLLLCHIGSVRRRTVKFWNDSGTNRARIADSSGMRVRSRRYLASTRLDTTRSGIELPIH